MCADLRRRGHVVVAALRERPSSTSAPYDDVMVTGPLERLQLSTTAFRGIDAVVHTANWNGTASSAATPAYVEAVNVRASAKFCDVAARSGVSQFIYLSSIKAVGNRTRAQSFDESTLPSPVDPYGRSKLQAERALLDTGGLLISIIRPPLIYGPGMKGSMLTLFGLAARRVPLPLASVKNARDFLALTSLADLVSACVERPSHSNRIVLARDGEAVSSATLYQRIAQTLGKEARLFSVPPRALRFLAACAGGGDKADSLLSSLEIDDRISRDQLGWKPICGMQEALASTAQWYLAQRAACG